MVKSRSFSPKNKKNSRFLAVFPFLVAGVGFEPHDLRVMSPTSYQAAPSRDMMLIYNIPYFLFCQRFISIIFIINLLLEIFTMLW